MRKTAHPACETAAVLTVSQPWPALSSVVPVGPTVAKPFAHNRTLHNPHFAVVHHSLIVIAGAGLTGWTNCFVLGPLWGVAIAYVFQRDTSPGAAAALTISVFAWAVVSHAELDILGLGASPPEPSWGSMLVAQSQSWGAQVASALSFLMIAIFAFSSSDIISRKT
ncbi:membrane hypothetical protein [Agrobacterium deltaense Zutra 3/1]|uniref:Uncharacterized protein n=1 Tax=Agrobacterium deltaense Zutra 3/1 TaxID=1183427 RepID=A0A1S7RAF1_9HYPH|nr:membrane hypothetical protein [Agrobacterium deltaense Zutra 3/1]